MRLLLDEHYSPEIAQQLRTSHGHDVLHAGEVSEVKGRFDPIVLEWAVEHGRVLVTENVRDFLPLHQVMLARGDQHGGLIFSNPRQLPRSKATIGLFVRSIDFYLRTLPTDFSLANAVEWLMPYHA